MPGHDVHIAGGFKHSSVGNRLSKKERRTYEAMIGKRKEEILPVKAYNPWTRPWNTVSGGDGQGEGPTCFRGPSISDSMVLHGAETSGKEKPIITEAQKMYRGLGILESTPRFNPAAASANARLDRGRSGPTREDEFSAHCAPFQTEFFSLIRCSRSRDIFRCIRIPTKGVSSRLRLTLEYSRTIRIPEDSHRHRAELSRSQSALDPVVDHKMATGDGVDGTRGRAAVLPSSATDDS